MAGNEAPHTSRAVDFHFPVPFLNFENRSGRNDTLIFASSSVQGWRLHMEDRHTCDLQISKKNPAAYFGVFDGHSGDEVAEFASEHLHKKIVKTQGYPDDIRVAIERSIINLDAEMRAKIQPPTEAGSTAIIIIIKDNKVYCGNLGDSRAVAYSTSNQTVPLSQDHKPSLPQELERIRLAGGFVRDDRIDYRLAMSRALGDYAYKADTNLSFSEQKVSCVPDVMVMDSEAFKFIVLASDGVWDMMSSEEVCNFINKKIDLLLRPGKIVKEVLIHCLAPHEQIHVSVGVHWESNGGRLAGGRLWPVPCLINRQTAARATSAQDAQKTVQCNTGN